MFKFLFTFLTMSWYLSPEVNTTIFSGKKKKKKERKKKKRDCRIEWSCSVYFVYYLWIINSRGLLLSYLVDRSNFCNFSLPITSFCFGFICALVYCVFYEVRNYGFSLLLFLFFLFLFSCCKFNICHKKKILLQILDSTLV